MANFGSRPIWALVILAALSVGGVNAAAPSLAPAMSPTAVKSPVKTTPPTTATSPAMAVTPTAAAPTPDCMTQIYNMTDCLTYVEKGSNTTKPDKGCCPELAGMLDSNPICLCKMLAKSSDLPIELNFNKALKLPSVCGLQTPPISMCSEIGIPVGAPAASGISTEAPSSTPSSAPGMTMSPGMSMAPGGGEAASPSAGKNGVSASNSYSTLCYLMSALAIALSTM